MPFADPGARTNDLGCDEAEGLAAADRMRGAIQKLIGKTRSPEIVLAALGTGFFDALEQTGYPVEWHSRFLIEAFTTFSGECETDGVRARIPKRVRKAGATMLELNDRLVDDGFNPLAVAWSYCGAIGDIVRQTSPADHDRVAGDLIRHINAARRFIANQNYH